MGADVCCPVRTVIYPTEAKPFESDSMLARLTRFVVKGYFEIIFSPIHVAIAILAAKLASLPATHVDRLQITTTRHPKDIALSPLLWRHRLTPKVLTGIATRVEAIDLIRPKDYVKRSCQPIIETITRLHEKL